MKQTYFVAALLALCLALAVPVAFAQDDAAADTKIMTVSEVRDMDNGAEVVVQVTITKGLAAGKFAVEDSTGPLRIKVDKALWPDGKPARDGALITVYGTLKKKGNSVEIEATKIIVN